LDMVRAELNNPTEEDDDMSTAKEIAKAVWTSEVTDAAGKKITAGQALQRVVQQGLAKQGADETWTRQVTAPDGTKVAVGAAVQATLRHAYAAARDGAISRALAEEAAKGHVMSDEEIARLADEVADRVQAITADDIAPLVAAQLVITATD